MPRRWCVLRDQLVGSSAAVCCALEKRRNHLDEVVENIRLMPLPSGLVGGSW